MIKCRILTLAAALVAAGGYAYAADSSDNAARTGSSAAPSASVQVATVKVPVAISTPCPDPPCGPKCGNSRCESGENCQDCPGDCRTGLCPNGNCEPNRGENCGNSADCPCTGGAECRNGQCVVPDPWCGDTRCNGGETCRICPEDCGQCPCDHDGVCFGGLRACEAECPGTCVRRVGCGESGYKCFCS